MGLKPLNRKIAGRRILGRLLIDYRKMQGLQLRDVANALDMDEAFLYRIEHGKARVPEDKLGEIINVYKIRNDSIKLKIINQYLETELPYVWKLYKTLTTNKK